MARKKNTLIFGQVRSKKLGHEGRIQERKMRLETWNIKTIMEKSMEVVKFSLDLVNLRKNTHVKCYKVLGV